MAVSFSDYIAVIPAESHTETLIDTPLEFIVNNPPEAPDAEEKKEKIYSSHTKFCIYGFSKCRKGTKCIYAHTFKQLNPITCKWDAECLRKEKCYFKHTSETKVQYVKRAFPDDIKRLNIVLYDDTPVKPKENENKNDTENIYIEEEQTPEQQMENERQLKECREKLYRLYYDPIFEYWSWADINEIVDSDEEEW